MKVLGCPYICFVNLLGDKIEGNCNLYPKENYGSLEFVSCESIPIIKCKIKRKIRGIGK